MGPWLAPKEERIHGNVRNIQMAVLAFVPLVSQLAFVEFSRHPTLLFVR